MSRTNEIRDEGVPVRYLSRVTRISREFIGKAIIIPS